MSDTTIDPGWQQPSFLAAGSERVGAGDAVDQPASGRPGCDQTPVVRSETGTSIGTPRSLLIVDVETTGTDPRRDRCVELGALLFSVPDRAVLCQVSALFPVQQNAAEFVNRISPASTRRKQPRQEALRLFAAMARQADAAVAHNAAFDSGWFGVEPLPALDLPWICTCEAMVWPGDLHLRSNPSLRDLALAHDIPVWAAHRALTDCVYLAQIFERCADLEQRLLEALQPRHLYRAEVSYDNRHLAKAAGFRWDPESRIWSRRLSESQRQALEFPVVRLEESSTPAE